MVKQGAAMKTLGKNNNYMSNKEIVQYYGQIWDNVKHMKSYVKELKQRYIRETQS
jgi:hypothetical protein